MQDRLRNVLSSERFVDVYFYVGGEDKSQEETGGPYRRSSRCYTVLSPRPPMCPVPKRSTASAQRRQNTEQQRMIPSAIAQASGNTSAAATASPAGSDTEMDSEDLKSKESTVTEKAKTLAEMLLSMQNTTTTPEELSPASSQGCSPSTSSSPSEISSYLNGTSNVAVMCHLSDTSDIDILQNGESEILPEKQRLPTGEKLENQKSQETERDTSNGEVKRFGAHRLILAIASPVFEAMFFGAFAEGGTKLPGSAALMKKDGLELHVTDVTAAVSATLLSTL